MVVTACLLKEKKKKNTYPGMYKFLTELFLAASSHVPGMDSTRGFSLTKILLVALLMLLCAMAQASGQTLDPYYYGGTCPMAESIVREVMQVEVARDPLVAAQLLRLHFHDCFVLGCDASVLLDDGGGVVSEKGAVANAGSLRGFDVIDRAKALLEVACPLTVSCADVIAIAARDAVLLVSFLAGLIQLLMILGFGDFVEDIEARRFTMFCYRGGPNWEVHLGRRDSLKASLSEANQMIPAPNFTLQMLIPNFESHGLNIIDLVALSGSHTMGRARCLSFRSRIYGQQVDEQPPDYYRRETVFRRILRSICPTSGRDAALIPLDTQTPAWFDNRYFHNLLRGEGLLESDDALVSEDDDGAVRRLVHAYAADPELFFRDFVRSIVKMGSIGVLTGDQGEVRRNCRRPNYAQPGR
ncbi:hypothetical protein Taro_036616 [Colocasia esculenta]|uniref:Peroxidase n=1 Tax=Colocasia esculenta TaxID=4460 RepID=A0A843W8W2_COLES|nr:hypothetical protein [Colocasia esculenta]